MSRPDRERGAWAGGVFAGAFLALACSRSPDIVATKSTEARSDGSIMKFGDPFQACRAGIYRGTMSSEPSPGWPYQFSGDINFSLVETPSGEFQVLKDTSKLSGTGENGSTFEATIPGGSSCVDGEFKTTLNAGTYQISSGSAVISFHGWIDGQYSAKSTGFTGNWSTVLQLVPTNDAAVLDMAGHWAAIWSGDK